MTLSRATASSPTRQKHSSTSPITPTAAAAPCPHGEYSTMAPTPGMRRVNSLGPLRRAHPASGATWNVEVIRGKMTSRCLWHACKALVLGLVLMVVGAGMATIGYYAVPLSAGHVEKGSNSTATAFIKNISRGYHLNNLSYIGPIVMGFGGFIVVAACVMTFEARDSAAKVVPARFKMSTTSGGGGVAAGGGSGRGRNSSGIRRGATGAPNGCSSGAGGGGGGGGPSSVGSQTTTTRWDRESTRESAAGPFRASPGDKYPDRQALTAALIHFSRALGTPKHSPSSSRRASEVSRSGSVPNLHGEVQSPNRNCFLSKGGIVTASGIGFRPSQQNQYYQKQQQQPSHHHHHYHSHHRNNTSGHHRRTSSRHSSLTKRSTREQQTDRFLHPGMLKYHRHAVSVDESHPPPSCLRPILSNSRQNVLLGSHPTMNSSSTSPTHHDSVIRMMRRSDTAKQHILARQRNIEESGNNKAALHSQFSSGSGGGGRRRSSTASDASMGMQQQQQHMTTTCSGRRSPTVSRTPSVDSRGVVGGTTCEMGADGVASSASPRREWRVSAQTSTPSVEKEFRSQLSICSEPAIASSSSPKALSCQSSIEPCVPEEGSSSPDAEQQNTVHKMELASATATKPRPDTLILECPLTTTESVPSKYLSDAQKATSRSFKKKQPRKPVQKNASVAEIYFISTETEEQQGYDSIEVIDERRNKSFGQMGSVNSINSNNYPVGDSGNLERTDTVIYKDSKSTVKEEKKANATMEAKEKEKDEVDTNTVTIMAEIEQRRSSNVSETDT